MKFKKRSICRLALVCMATVLPGQAQKSPNQTNWMDYGGGVDALQYSPLQQINKKSVGQLTQAWFYSVPGLSARFSYSPLIVDGRMYVLGSGKTIVCLDAATGKEMWTHPTEGTPTDRGINYWESKDRTDRRLIFSADSFLQEIDARTGASIRSFGMDGRINLREGLGRDPKTIPEIQTGTPGHVFENMIILGSATSESYGSPPGDIRAYDVLTGKTVWSFHTVPHPGEFGYDTWPKDAWKYIGGVNTWGEFAIDTKRAIGYFPLGSPTYDFWGGDRIGAGLYGDCLLALDLRTGNRLWYFQTVHHDLWDYDPTTAPKLLTVRHDGKTVDVVAQATKSGFLFVFDRVSGKPLWPIEERPVPKSDAPGEESWPTQPVPTKPLPFARQSFTEKDIDPYISDADKAHILEILRAANNQGIFTPGTDKRNSIQIPADDGGANWGNGAADPKTGVVYLRTSDSPELKYKLSQKLPLRVPHSASAEMQGHAIFSQLCQGCHGPNRTGVMSPKDIGIDKFKKIVSGGEGEMPGFSDLQPEYLDALAAYISNPAAGGPALAAAPGGGMERLPPPPGITRYFGTYENRILSTDGLPAISPPWTSLVAIDLNDGELKWRVPIGVVPGLAAKGIKDTGTAKVSLAANRTAPIVTAGGLVFIATWPDRTIHAYDEDTGKLLWEQEIEANPEGLPSVYEVDGREYIVFCASGHPPEAAPAEGFAWKAGKAEAQGYYAFALPKQ
jgi:quinoprotein glucose dehydrogenase